MNWFQGDACSWAPQAGTSPGLYTLPTLKSPSWPRTVWTDFRSFYLSGLARRRGSDSVWSLPALPQRSPPGGLCPLAYSWGCPGDAGVQAGQGRRANWQKQWRKRRDRGAQPRRHFPASVGGRRTSLQCHRSPPGAETRPFCLPGGGAC